jgi:hypothetical protein
VDFYKDEFLVSVLVHTPTTFYFRFGPHSDEYSPGLSSRVDSQKVPDFWPSRLSLVAKWLGNVRREYEAPDLWEMFLQETKLSRVAFHQT